MKHKFGATSLLIKVIAVCLAFTGIVHGIREMSYGNIPTGGMLLKEVGAFTLVQNYLITGFLAITAGFLAMVWTLNFIETKNGPAVFLVIFVILFLTGGGFAQVLPFTIAWAVSTRINQPLAGWLKIVPGNIRKVLAEKWMFFFAACMGLFGTGILIWLTGYVPGVKGQDMRNYITWAFLAAGLMFLLLTVVAGFCKDAAEADPK